MPISASPPTVLGDCEAQAVGPATPPLGELPNLAFQSACHVQPKIKLFVLTSREKIFVFLPTLKLVLEN